MFWLHACLCTYLCAWCLQSPGDDVRVPETGVRKSHHVSAGTQTYVLWQNSNCWAMPLACINWFDNVDSLLSIVRGQREARLVASKIWTKSAHDKKCFSLTVKCPIQAHVVEPCPQLVVLLGRLWGLTRGSVTWEEAMRCHSPYLVHVHSALWLWMQCDQLASCSCHYSSSTVTNCIFSN